MMHVCPMQAMSSRVGLHPAARHYLGTSPRYGLFSVGELRPTEIALP